MIAPNQHRPCSPAGAATDAARQLMVALLVLLAVGLLTLLFSFLGTISCAAVLGMMFSTMRQSKWQVVLISFVFPLVSFAVSGALAPERNLLLASICFGVFWAVYLLTCAALYLEQSPSGASLTGADRPDRAALMPVETAEPAYDPSLRELQGSWDRQGAAAETVRSVRRIEVTRDRLLVMVSGAEGSLQPACSGQVQVRQVGPYKMGVLSETKPSGPAIPAPFSAAMWLYKVQGETLTIAWNFESTSQHPYLESYARTL